MRTPKKQTPQRFYLRAPEGDATVQWSDCLRVPTEFSAPFEPTGNRSIFSFVGEIGQMTSGPLIFSFSLDRDAKTAKQEFRSLSSKLVREFNVSPHDITWIKNGSKSLLVVIEQCSFHEEFPGSYLPTIYGFMLHEISTKKYATLNYDLYREGIHSSINFEGIQKEKYIAYYRKATDSFGYEESKEVINDIYPPQKNYLPTIFENCLRSHVRNNITAIKKEKFQSNSHHTLFHKVFFRCEALKEATNAHVLSQDQHRLFLQSCRCLGEDGKQAAYMYNDLRRLLPVEISRHEWFASKTANAAPPSCSKLRKQKACKRPIACGVIHPAELAYKIPRGKQAAEQPLSAQTVHPDPHRLFCQQNGILPATASFFNIKLIAEMMLTALICQGKFVIDYNGNAIPLTLYAHIAGSDEIPKLQTIFQPYVKTILSIEKHLVDAHKHLHKQSKIAPRPRLIFEKIMPSSFASLHELDFQPIYLADQLDADPTTFSNALLSRSKNHARFVTALLKAHKIADPTSLLLGCLNQSSCSVFARLWQYRPIKRRGILNKFLLFSAQYEDLLSIGNVTFPWLSSERMAQLCLQNKQGPTHKLQLSTRATDCVNTCLQHILEEFQPEKRYFTLTHLRPVVLPQILKIAALLHLRKHLAGDIPDKISLQTAEAAASFIYASLDSTVAVYNQSGINRTINCAQAIASWLFKRKRPHVYARDIHRSFAQTYSLRVVKEAIKHLCAKEVITLVHPEYQRPRGKPSKNLFLVNQFLDPPFDQFSN